MHPPLVFMQGELNDMNWKLNWKPQVKELNIKFGGKLKFLKKFKGLPSSVLEEIYFKGIVPSITY